LPSYLSHRSYLSYLSYPSHLHPAGYTPLVTPDRKRQLIFAAVLAVLTLLRITQIDALHDQGHFTKYLAPAESGRVPVDRLSDFSPTYFWALMLLHGKLHLAFATLRALQIVAVSIAAFCVAMAARRAGGWIAAGAAATLLLTSKAALLCATEAEPETLILVAASVALLLFGSRRTPALFGAGLALGIAAATRPGALLAILLLAGWQIAREGLARRCLAFVAGAALPILIVLGVNLMLTGDATIMDPGTVFYEGMNPSATGYAGVQPRIVNDLEQTAHEADYLHVAYRLIAARAAGRPLTRAESNHYWTSKALAFVEDEPAAALRLAARKLVLASHSYDAWDLATLVSKSGELGSVPWLPFGALFSLALAGFLLRRDEVTVPAALYSLASAATLILFYVTSRQRNAVLPGLSILGGVAVGELVARCRVNPRRAFLFGAAIVAASLVLTLDGPRQHEDAHGWRSAFLGGEASRAAAQAMANGDSPRAAGIQAVADTLLPASMPRASLPAVAAVARQEAERTGNPARLFDLAVAMEKAGAWADADRVLARLEGYVPIRENRATGSVSYYRARAALHLGRPADALLHQALNEAPGDANVLALAGVMAPARLTELDRLHDPFTRDLALAQAHLDLGQREQAGGLLRELERRMPEWWRPRAIEVKLEASTEKVRSQNQNSEVRKPPPTSNF
jgi:hypothetical protein